MQVKTGLPGADWDKVVGAQGGHFLQSREWASFQQALGRDLYWSADQGWSWLGTVRQVSRFRYLYLAYGPTAPADSLKPALASLSQLASEQKLDFVRIEPVGTEVKELESSGFKLEPIEEIEPAMTSLVNLQLSEDQLRQKLASGHRNAINGAVKRGIGVRLGAAEESAEFNRLIGQTARKAGIRVHESEYFNKMLETLMPLKAARLYLAEVEGRVVAATIILTSDRVWYYAHAASDPAYMRLQAGVPLLWKVILDAKAEGVAIFDLWGVVPADDQGPKAGYSRFKRAFGGTDKLYAGTWDLIVSPSRYQLFKLARGASRTLRKVRRR